MTELLAVLLAVTGLAWAVPMTVVAIRRDQAAQRARQDARVARRAQGVLVRELAGVVEQLVDARRTVEGLRRPPVSAPPPARGEHIRWIRQLDPDGVELIRRRVIREDS